jgi:voltage-gated potassium channel Kch
MRHLIRRLDARFPGWVNLVVAILLWASLTASNLFVTIAGGKLTLLVLMALAVAFFLLRFAYQQRYFWGPVLGFVLLLITSASLIESFAELYEERGIIDPDGEIIVRDDDDGTQEDADCLYFSIVTFTTLGYGDFRPTPQCRMFAATEAVLGYIYFGLTVAILFDLVQRKRRSALSESQSD